MASVEAEPWPRRGRGQKSQPGPGAGAQNICRGHGPAGAGAKKICRGHGPAGAGVKKICRGRGLKVLPGPWPCRSRDVKKPGLWPYQGRPGAPADYAYTYLYFSDKYFEKKCDKRLNFHQNQHNFGKCSNK